MNVRRSIVNASNERECGSVPALRLRRLPGPASGADGPSCIASLVAPCARPDSLLARRQYPGWVERILHCLRQSQQRAVVETVLRSRVVHMQKMRAVFAIAGRADV